MSIELNQVEYYSNHSTKESLVWRTRLRPTGRWQTYISDAGKVSILVEHRKNWYSKQFIHEDDIFYGYVSQTITNTCRSMCKTDTSSGIVWLAAISTIVSLGILGIFAAFLE